MNKKTKCEMPSISTLYDMGYFWNPEIRKKIDKSMLKRNKNG